MTEIDSKEPGITIEKVVNKGGRPKGSANRATAEFRETVNRLLRDNEQNVSTWLSEVAAKNPAKALDILIRLAEFVTPKLTSTEITGDANNPLSVQTITRQIVDPLTITQNMAEIRVLTSVNGDSEILRATQTIVGG